MPLIFIHGVNTRDTDPDYYISMAARRKQFEEIVAKNLRGRYPNFRVADDLYWGDLGVKFRWSLHSIPSTSMLQSLGPGALQLDSPALLQLISEVGGAAQGQAAPASGDVQELGSPAESHVLVQAVGQPPKDRKPGDIVRTIFAQEAARSDPAYPADSKAELDVAGLKAQGEQLILLFRAAEQVAKDVDSNPGLLALKANDEDLLTSVQSLVYTKYGELVSAPEEAVAPGDVQTLGRVEDAKAWAVTRLKGLMDGAKAVVAKVRDVPARATTLFTMQALREQISQRGLRFFGDVLVYLYQGYNGPIAKKVQQGILGAWKTASDSHEPLVVVTHSFGSIIFYDALTSGGLDGVEVKLWVSAGAQTSLFAEMALYRASNPNLPTAQQLVLGKPAQVEKWVNFYDAADILSYVHEPVFGTPAVTDVEVREGANLATAHGHYFLTDSFYQRVSAEMP